MRAISISSWRWHFIGLVVVGLLCPWLSIANDELRNWSDKSGKNKIKAKFVKLEDDIVTLEKPDGEEVEIELKKLSAADAKFATEAAKESEENPFKSKGSNPFKPKSKSEKPKPETDDDDPEELPEQARPREIKFDLSKAKKISQGTSAGRWKVEIPSNAKVAPTDFPQSISIPGRSNFFEKVAALRLSYGQTSRSAVVGYLLDRQTNSPTTRIAICDLTSGKATNAMIVAGKMAPIALHDDGKQVLMQRYEFGHDKKDRLELWTMKGTKISKSISWTPYHADKHGHRDVVWAQFLSEEKLATCGSSGTIVIWKFPEIQPLCQFESSFHAIPAVSPDRRLIAYCTGKDIGLFDVEKQKILAQRSIPSSVVFPSLAFSPSGARLACLASNNLLVWDVATGKLMHEISCAGVHALSDIDFTDDQFVLVYKSIVIDLENEVKLWTYNGAEHACSIDGVTYFVVMDGDKKPGALIAAQIPHPAAKDLVKKAVTEPEMFALHSGTTVRIDVSGIPDASQRDQAIKGLTKCVEAIGCKVGSTGTVDLVASVDGPKDTEVTFSFVGTYKFKEYNAHLKFVYQNQTIWEQHQSNVPGVASLAPGQNMDGYLRSIEKPDYDYFNRVAFPKFLQKPGVGISAGATLTLGESRVTTDGIR